MTTVSAKITSGETLSSGPWCYYHASLKEKESYHRTICRYFPEPYDDSRVILDEITHAQDLFLSGVPLRKTIARNLALKKNVFMMIICIELKIPLFLVGKPGSSKSLAKTIMGIINTFKQCACFQQGKDLQQYVSVVVLDEVVLAEDSPKMPMKALNPLLEKELIESARGICSSDSLVQDRVQGYFSPFAEAYEMMCHRQNKKFFGLCDYYSLIKMVFSSARASNNKPSCQNIVWAVLQNFSGKDDIPTLDIFMVSLPEARCVGEFSTLELIKDNNCRDMKRVAVGEMDEAESCYLLILAKNYMTLQILQQSFFSENQQPEIIFGSSFPLDQEYAQIFRNINQVKICMETFKMVVLLNLQHLYESLYNVLNQYYVYLGSQKYVDLGHPSRRVLGPP
ncbi:hypothetical protein GHT09_008012 [Marmota monax]|uniref:Uncharacterized protein n=1 Tax=Marmota monax TaxID=9995 RepID=A0A834QMJ4_MARMO|nr:hypothetical protein GHT09_008012 [Marmota monax]